MKEVHKQKRLSGPGMDTSDIPGVTAGGGKWPSRFVPSGEIFSLSVCFECCIDLIFQLRWRPKLSVPNFNFSMHKLNVRLLIS